MKFSFWKKLVLCEYKYILRKNISTITWVPRLEKKSWQLGFPFCNLCDNSPSYIISLFCIKYDVIQSIFCVSHPSNFINILSPKKPQVDTIFWFEQKTTVQWIQLKWNITLCNFQNVVLSMFITLRLAEFSLQHLIKLFVSFVDYWNWKAQIMYN